MLQPKQAFLSLPGSELQGFPVQIFPGATASDLITVLKKNPEISAKVNLDQQRVIMFENEIPVVFEPSDELYPIIKQGSVLELLPNDAPPFG